MYINGYKLDDDGWRTVNSGFSKWGFCKKGRKNYFIKEFLNPTYPMEDAEGVLSEIQIERKKKECLDFEKKVLKIYTMMNRISDGNVVRICDFFRCNSKYYIVTEKADFHALPISRISAYSYKIKKHICKVIAHAVWMFHEEGFVHADIKPNNILVNISPERRKYTAKIIDFDCGFFGTEPPAVGEELNGDPVYFAPEMIMHMMEEEVALSCKIDVYALGILFHQYMTGEQPLFDKDKYDYLAEAILDGGNVSIDGSIPMEFADLLKKMIKKEPGERLSVKEIYFAIDAMDKTAKMEEKEEPKENVTDFPKREEYPETNSKLRIYKGNK